MSLKAFHLVFIFLSILLAMGCAAWSYLNKTSADFGVASAIVAAGLLLYGIWFMRKSRKIIV